MMIAISFDGRVRDDHLIGFYVPAIILPGSVCSFQVTITLPNSGGGSTVIRMFTFTAVVPADRKIIFTVPADVPLGWYHFTILCTVLTTMMTMTTTSASTKSSSKKKSTKTTADNDAEYAANQSVCILSQPDAAK